MLKLALFVCYFSLRNQNLQRLHNQKERQKLDIAEAEKNALASENNLIEEELGIISVSVIVVVLIILGLILF